MNKRPWRLHLTITTLAALGIFIAWVFRSPIERFLASIESDYTESSEL